MRFPTSSFIAGTILSVGIDLDLLRTRQMVLELTGASVTSVEPEQALSILRSRQFDVVVLCHGISCQDASAICRLACDRSASTSIVLLGHNCGLASGPAHRTLVLSPSVHPALLVEAAQGLLPPV